MENLIGRYCTETFDENGVLKDFKINPSDNFNFGYDVVDEIAKTDPNRRAMVWCNLKGEQRTFTFKEISDLSNQTANYLLSKGIKKGDNVMLMLKRHYEFWYVMIALHKIGAIVIPATHMLKSHDIVYRVNAANVKSVIFTKENGVPEQILEAKKECSQLEHLFCVNEDINGCENLANEIKNMPTTLDRIQTNCEDIMIAYFTSGTTGYPKLVVHMHSYAIAHVVTAKYWLNVDPDGLHFTISDTGWGKAVWGKLYGQWFLGAAVMVYDFDKFIPEDILDIIEKYNVTSFCAPPTMYRFFIKQGFGNHSLSCLKYACTAGEPMNLEIIKQFKKKTGLMIKEAFGQTETTCITASIVGAPVKEGSIGTASPLYNVELVDQNLEPVKPGEVGEICIRPDGSKSQVGLFKEYLNAPDLNEKVWNGGIYHTGDTATRDEDGYFYYVGRTDDIIKSSGYRIGPFEIESVLIEHPSVLECGISGVPDEVRGQVIKATIVLTKDYSPSKELEEELKTYVKEKTAPYKYPRIIEFVEELPKTISGKIRRNVLRGESKA